MVILATLLLREAIEKIDVFFIKLTIILFRQIGRASCRERVF